MNKGEWDTHINAMAEDEQKTDCGALTQDLNVAVAQRGAARKELADAWGYASRLFKSLAPQCEPLDHIMGVLTQINNWSTGTCPKEELAALRAENQRLVERKQELVGENDHGAV